jgi:hypothetical protein
MTAVNNQLHIQLSHSYPSYTQFFSDTLQIFDDIRIPYGKHGDANYLEPLTKDYSPFGIGGATQAVTNKAIALVMK